MGWVRVRVRVRVRISVWAGYLAPDALRSSVRRSTLSN